MLFDRDNVNDDQREHEWSWWRRRPSVLQARQIDEPFSVQTPHGVVEGQAGDWVAIDANGDPYPIAADVFEAAFDAAPNGPGV